jgi:DNA-binding MarR family transcriptional regulator
MTRTSALHRPAAKHEPAPATAGYRLEEQIGYVLRKAHQRATAIFARHFGPHQLTPTQWTTLVRIRERGNVSQNHLGRLTAMDPATIQGVVQRLIERDLITRTPDPKDGRRKRLALTPSGEALVEARVAEAFKVSRETLKPLTAAERAQLLELLSRLG